MSIALHGGLFVSLATVFRTAPESSAERQPSSIPVAFVELAPAPSPSVEPSLEPVSPDVPPAGTSAGAIAPAPSASSAVTALPVDPPQPVASPVAPSAEPAPQPTAEPPDPSPEAEATTSPSPEALPDVSEDSTATPEGLDPDADPAAIASSPSLPNLPPTLPGSPAPPAGNSALNLPQVTVAEAVNPVEITASVSIQANASSETPSAEQSDRQTFTYDPTGASGLAIATCPFVPDVSRFAGETVTLQVQLDEGGIVQAAEVYKSSTTSAAYEAFATCLVENWDFSRLPGADMSNVLFVSITIETTRS